MTNAHHPHFLTTTIIVAIIIATTIVIDTTPFTIGKVNMESARENCNKTSPDVETALGPTEHLVSNSIVHSETIDSNDNDTTNKEPSTHVSRERKENGIASAEQTEPNNQDPIRPANTKKSVEDYNFGRTLGDGSYSTVVLGSEKTTSRQCAIKILRKSHISKEKMVKYVGIEQKALRRLLGHPGIILLYCTFQDKDSLYFVLGFASNGELLTLIRTLKSLSEECTRFYGAQLLDAVQFMHSRGVIHRDLKPENILLDGRMRIKVTDFGTAKLLDHETDKHGNELNTYSQNIRASSFVGTAQYVAPELLNDKYVTKACDLWAYGCILYIMIAGKAPFNANTEYLTFQKISKLKYSYPPNFPTIIRDLIEKLLVLNPDRRYTTLQIKQHQFFAEQDWSTSAIWKSPPPSFFSPRPASRHTSNPANSVFSGRASAPSTPVAQVSSGKNTSSSYFPRQSQQASVKQPNGNIPRSRAASSPNIFSTNSTQQQHTSTAVDSNQAVFSAAAGAAAALAKPVSKISPYYTPTQPHTQPPPSANFRTPVQPPASTRHTARVVPRIRTSDDTPSSSSNTASSVISPSQPISSSAKVVQPSQTSTASSTPFPRKSSPPPSSQQKAPVSPLQPSPLSITPLDVPPLSQVDRELTSLRIQHDERILKIGSVMMSVTSSNNAAHPSSSPHAEFHNILTGIENNGTGTNSQSMSTNGSDEERKNEEISEKEPSRIAKLFSANRKKKRILLVTTIGRLVVVSSIDETRKLYLDLRVVAPQVTVRELPYNRKTNMGVFMVESHNKIFLFEDSQGSTDWIAAIDKARVYVDNVEAIAASKKHVTAAAAAMAAAASSSMRSGAVGIGKTSANHTPLSFSSGNGAGGSGNRLVRGANSNSTPEMRSLIGSDSQGRRSSDMDALVNGTSSMFLKRSGERKSRKG